MREYGLAAQRCHGRLPGPLTGSEVGDRYHVWALWPGWSLLFLRKPCFRPGEDPRTPLQCIRKCWVSQVNPFRLCPLPRSGSRRDGNREVLVEAEVGATSSSEENRKTVLPFSHVKNISWFVTLLRKLFDPSAQEFSSLLKKKFLPLQNT